MVVSRGSVATGYVNHSNHKTTSVNKVAKMPTQRLKQTCNIQLVNELHASSSSQKLLLSTLPEIGPGT